MEDEIKTGALDENNIHSVLKQMNNLYEKGLKDTENEKKQIISDYFSNLARLSHQKHPRGRDYYVKMGKMGKRKPKVI